MIFAQKRRGIAASICLSLLLPFQLQLGAAFAANSVPVAPKPAKKLSGSVNQNAARLYRPSPSMAPVAGSNYVMSQPGSVPPEPSGSLVSGADFSAFSQPAGAVTGAGGNSGSAFSSSPSPSSSPSSSSSSNYSAPAAGQSHFDTEKAVAIGAALALQLGKYVSEEKARKALKGAAAAAARAPLGSAVGAGIASATGFTGKYSKVLSKQEISQLSKYDVVVVIDKDRKSTRLNSSH